MSNITHEQLVSLARHNELRVSHIDGLWSFYGDRPDGEGRHLVCQTDNILDALSFVLDYPARALVMRAAWEQGIIASYCTDREFWRVRSVGESISEATVHRTNEQALDQILFLGAQACAS